VRTTLDIDAPVLADLKRLGQARHIPMGRLASEMLGRALRETSAHPKKTGEFTWIDRPMNAKVDVADREALYDAMDGEGKA
jgi:hypothetical protein